MNDTQSDNPTDPDWEDMEQTLACVEQMTREFDNMIAQSRMDNAQIATMSEELQCMAGGKSPGSSPTGRGDPVPLTAFQKIEQSLARVEAMGKEMCQAASAFAQELINWVEELGKRASRHSQRDAGLAATVAVGATLDAPPLTRPPLESASTASGPESAPPEPPDVPNLGPATVVAGVSAAAAAAAGTWALTFSEVMGKREANIIKYGNPYGPPSRYAHGSGYTGGSSGDRSDVQKGWILYDGERRWEDGTIRTSSGRIVVDANGNSVLSDVERKAIAQGDGSVSGASNHNPSIYGLKPMPGSRTTGVDRAKALEVQLVQTTGAGTLDWTPQEIQYIQQTSNLPRGIIGHHINNVAIYPNWAGDPRNVQFVRGQTANLQQHAGNYQNPTTGPLIDRAAIIQQATRRQK